MTLVQTNKRAEATKLRLQGKSYGEIMRILNIPSKGTLSYWFHSLKLTTKAKKRLQRNVRLAQQRGLVAFNKKRTKSILADNKNVFEQSRDEILSLSKKEILLIGTALYWAEGVNKKPNRGYQTIAFTNSNPRLVSVFMHYLRSALDVSDDKIKPGVIIYPNLDPEIAKNFWSQITKLPRKDFWITVAISKASKMKKKPNYLPYGTLHIRVNGRRFFYKIQGHIAGIAKQLL